MTKRVNLSLSMDDYEVIKDYANRIGSTPTGVINNLVSELAPSLKSVIKLYDQADTRLSDSVQGVQSMALEKIHEVSGAAKSLADAFEDDQLGIFPDDNG